MNTQGKRTLYISDMDGTLLGSDSKLSARSASMLNAAINRGILFTVATARTPATVQPLLHRVKQSSYTDASGHEQPLPSIVMTGAGLWDRSRVAFSEITLIPEVDAINIEAAFRREGIHPFIYCLSGNNFLNVYHPAAMSRREDSFYQERRHLELKRFHLDQHPAKLDKVAIFFAIGNEERVKRITTELQGVSHCAVAWYPDIFIPETGLMDIYAPGVSKANAVEALRHRTGTDEVVVFGDNLNDLPMMRVADVAVAVDNALPEVKEAADIVIGSNSSDAVPRFIMERHNISL